MTVEALWADICRNFAVWKGVGHFERKFQGERGVPHQRFLAPKSRVFGLSYGEKKLPKSSTAWVGCTNVTDDRQTTDGRPIAYSKRNVIRWRLLKIVAARITKLCKYWNLVYFVLKRLKVKVTSFKDIAIAWVFVLSWVLASSSSPCTKCNHCTKLVVTFKMTLLLPFYLGVSWPWRNVTVCIVAP